MNRKPATLYLDQYGNQWFARTVAELRKQIGAGGSRVTRMYEDRGNRVIHVGYVIGQHWCRAFAPIEKQVTP
jgi:hypothetical protein